MGRTGQTSIHNQTWRKNMKAKIKKTGEIINIADYARVTLESCDSYGNPLELGFDEVEILQEKSDEIDYEQRRYEIAKAFAANPNDMYVDADFASLARWSVEGADALIAELTKGGTL